MSWVAIQQRMLTDACSSALHELEERRMESVTVDSTPRRNRIGNLA
jgi:hypothetical protein